MPAPEVLARLEAGGLIRREGEGYRTTRRWQAAMARAAFHLVRTSDGGDDLRFPIAYALVDLFGSELPDDDMARFIEALLPIEIAELSPRERPDRVHPIQLRSRLQAQPEFSFLRLWAVIFNFCGCAMQDIDHTSHTFIHVTIMDRESGIHHSRK